MTAVFPLLGPLSSRIVTLLQLCAAGTWQRVAARAVTVASIVFGCWYELVPGTVRCRGQFVAIPSTVVPTRIANSVMSARTISRARTSSSTVPSIPGDQGGDVERKRDR